MVFRSSSLAARSIYAVVATVLLGLVLMPRAAPGQAPGKQFQAETTVTLVEVPVQVLLRGEPVRGLSADDFLVYDKGEQRDILFFEAVDLDELTVGAGDESRPSPQVPAAGRRHFLLFFDLEFTPPQFIAQAQEASLRLVREELEPTDLVGVAFYSGRRGASSVIGFTSDRDEVVRALEGLGRLLGEDAGQEGASEPAEGRERIVGDRLGLTYGGWNVSAAELGRSAARRQSLAEQAQDWNVGGGAAGGGKAPDGVGETLADMAAYAEEDLRQERAAEASAMVAALRSVARSARHVDGAKYLMLFSMGFESSLYTAEGQTWLYTEIEKMIEDFRRAGWTIEGIESGAVWSDRGRQERREALGMLADATGGQLVANRGGGAAAVGKILERTSVTYVLGFQSGEIPMDGSFRKVEVKLAPGAGVGRRARLVHRTGYFTPEAGRGADEPQAWLAEARYLLLAGAERDELGMGVVAFPVHLEEAAAQVPVMMELEAAGLTAGGAVGPRTAELYVYAFDDRGAVEVARTRRMTLDPARLPSPGGGFKLLEELDLPPGEHMVRVLAREPETGRTSLRVVRVWVPPSRDPFGVLLPPVFLQEAGEPWMLLRTAGTENGRSYPYLFRETRFLPSARPVLAHGDGRPLMVIGYGLPAEQLGLDVRVLDAEGRRVEGAALSFLDRQQGEAGAPDILALELDPGGLEPGVYSVQVALRGISDWTPGVTFQVVEGADREGDDAQDGEEMFDPSL